MSAEFEVEVIVLDIGRFVPIVSFLACSLKRRQKKYHTGTCNTAAEPG